MSNTPPLPLQLELMPREERIPEAPPPRTIVVRYGFLREIGEFPSDLTQKAGCGTKLVLRTTRGTEIGEMLATACGNGGCSKSITRDKLLAYIENSGGRNYPFSEEGRVLRVATAQDLAEQAKLDEHHHAHLALARELVQRHTLDMKIVDVEHLLGGERILFYFVAEHRIDFRGLVRDLAHELHTRIELRQVGARDEARLTADYEKCGQHCCCRQFLKVLTPISMRSAKTQKATLDPTKISGRCGRLMCCLRYEDQTYEELRKKLPKRNTRVNTEKGDGWVIDGQILTQLVLVQFDDGLREAVPMEKILAFDRPKPVLPDGRVMQTPNDRPPPGAVPPNADAGPRGGRGAGNGPPARNGAGGPPRNSPGRAPVGPPVPRGERPMPGAPAEGPEGDPWAISGPTGGDLSTGQAHDDIDDLIADAMDDAPPPSPQGLQEKARPPGPQPEKEQLFQSNRPRGKPQGPRPSQGFQPPKPQCTPLPTPPPAAPSPPAAAEVPPEPPSAGEASSPPADSTPQNS